jgi:HK97 gp10 family phage protein
MSIKLEGLKDLDAALGLLKQGAAKGVLRRTGRKALQPFDKAWRARAPVLSGALQKSGSVGSKLTKRQRAAVERENFVEVFAGPGANPQAIQEEFGNVHQAPHPFVRPAWDETKDQALQIVKTELGGELLKTVKRLARKSLKALGA